MPRWSLPTRRPSWTSGTRRGADFDRTEADVRHTTPRQSLMGELGVPVHDLHWVVEQGGPETMLGPDGTHYTVAGSDRLAEAVADCVLRQVTVRRYRPLPRPASGPEAAAEYRKAAARRDGLVPEAYRRLKVGEFPMPADAAAWKERRPPVLRAVVGSLGDLPPRPWPCASGSFHVSSALATRSKECPSATAWTAR